MKKFRGNPSPWLLKNSMGYPDFLFTILTYAMIVLIFLCMIWIAFAILSFFHAGTERAQVILKIMDNMKTGLISLAGVVFGLAGSYTVRRFKKDDHYIEKRKLEFELEEPNSDGGMGSQSAHLSIRDEQGNLGKIVTEEEDI